jgi:hypothetical protein
MTKTDRTTKLLLAWIATALTVIAFKEILPAPLRVAQASDLKGELNAGSGPVEIIIKEPVPVNIVDWNAYPSQPFKVKIDDPWPVKVKVDDDVKVKGELRLQD